MYKTLIFFQYLEFQTWVFISSSRTAFRKCSALNPLLRDILVTAGMSVKRVKKRLSNEYMIVKFNSTTKKKYPFTKIQQSYSLEMARTPQVIIFSVVSCFSYYFRK